uniref:Uncharacterized protein n=1 Tax=Meloidogyne incognita TaxID=6306 RepID=A0A914KQB2_MELIC
MPSRRHFYSASFSIANLSAPNKVVIPLPRIVTSACLAPQSVICKSSFSFKLHTCFGPCSIIVRPNKSPFNAAIKQDFLMMSVCNWPCMKPVMHSSPFVVDYVSLSCIRSSSESPVFIAALNGDLLGRTIIEHGPKHVWSLKEKDDLQIALWGARQAEVTIRGSGMTTLFGADKLAIEKLAESNVHEYGLSEELTLEQQGQIEMPS